VLSSARPASKNSSSSRRHAFFTGSISIQREHSTTLLMDGFPLSYSSCCQIKGRMLGDIWPALLRWAPLRLKLGQALRRCHPHLHRWVDRAVHNPYPPYCWCVLISD
jgi:hypothetical protein